jgi:putative ABC transport system permease protein
MLRNFFNTAFRFLRRNKVFAAINLFGLSIALAVSFIILLFVINELSYNSTFKNGSRIFRLNTSYIDVKKTMSGTPFVLASTLKKEFPQVERAANASFVIVAIKVNDQYVGIPQALGTTSDIFDIFSIPLVGDLSHDHMLDDMNSIVISGTQAKKLFPGIDPVGKEVQVAINGQEKTFTISGVFRDLPSNSTFRAQCFVNGKYTLDRINSSFNSTDAETNWDRDFWTTWVLLSKDSKAGDFSMLFSSFEKKFLGEKPAKNFLLQKFTDVYLKSDEVANTGMKGDLHKVKLFSSIAFLIALVAAINYIILSTAVSSSRAKEIGIRKTNGADNAFIKRQLLSESVLLSILVLPVAILLTGIALPYAGKLFQTRLSIVWTNVPVYLAVYIAVTILIGIASGVYTSYYLSNLKVIDILRNSIHYGNRKQLFRSSLIILQLVIFCSFVSSTLVIRSQYKYALNKDTGFYTKDILFVDLGRGFKEYSSLINSIKSNPDVINAAGTMMELPLQGYSTTAYPSFANSSEMVPVESIAVDFHFPETMGLKLVEGRYFSEDFGSDLSSSLILNETAVKKLGITGDPVGKMLGKRTIIGVCKDFNLHSIHSQIPPMYISMTDKYINQVAVHFRPGSLSRVLPFVKKEWEKAAPGRPFYYTPIEEMIQDIYSSEKNLTRIVTIAAIFTLLIAAMGLFGLTLFVSRTRTREIGIKKIYGCSGNEIVYSFLKANFILVLVSACLSVPVTWYFMTKWLSNFASRTSIGSWVFAISLIISLVVVMGTVFIHSFRASRINPVDALRYE